MHPAQPCPACGGKVKDGFSIRKVPLSGFWNRYYMRSTLRVATLRSIETDHPSLSWSDVQELIKKVKLKYGVQQ